MSDDDDASTDDEWHRRRLADTIRPCAPSASSRSSWVVFGPPLIFALQVPTSCVIADVRTTDEYLCALNGTSLGDPILVGGFVLAIWLGVIVGIAQALRPKA